MAAPYRCFRLDGTLADAMGGAALSVSSGTAAFAAGKFGNALTLPAPPQPPFALAQSYTDAGHAASGVSVWVNVGATAGSNVTLALTSQTVLVDNGLSAAFTTSTLTLKDGLGNTIYSGACANSAWHHLMLGGDAAGYAAFLDGAALTLSGGTAFNGTLTGYQLGISSMAGAAVDDWAYAPQKWAAADAAKIWAAGAGLLFPLTGVGDLPVWRRGGDRRAVRPAVRPAARGAVRRAG